MREVNIYVKSSIKSTRRRDGYIGYVLECITNQTPVTLNKFEKVEQLTSNQSELVAIIMALKRMKEKCLLTIYTDSRYIGSAVDNKWIDEWKRQQWTNSKGEPLANASLWQEMLNLLVGQQFSVIVGARHEYSTWMETELARMSSEKA